MLCQKGLSRLFASFPYSTDDVNSPAVKVNTLDNIGTEKAENTLKDLISECYFAHLMVYVGVYVHTCFLCRVELVVQFPAKGSTQVLLSLFPGVLLL